MRPSENYPPLHPRCRCIVNPHVTDWDAWLDRQADREAAKTRARRMGATGEQLRQTPKPSERADIKPINEQLYSTLKNIVERRGGEFLRGGEEVERHLDAQQAAASQVGGAIMFHDPPNTSEVLEEVFHFQQDQRGDYSDLPPDEMVLRREIAAQNYLLSVTKR